MPGRLAQHLHEAHVAPRRPPQRAGVVIARSAAEPDVVGRQVVPLLAGDLAGLAADAHRRVGEEAHLLGVRPADGDLAERGAHDVASSSGGGGWCAAWLVWPALSGSSAPWSPVSGLNWSSAACASRAVDSPWRRPARTSQENDLSSIETLGSPERTTMSLTVSPVVP